MSIVTKGGDKGMTALMYNRRVSKSHPRVEAYGSVDELNAALGWARANNRRPPLQEKLLQVQQDLVILMGELATGVEDLERFKKDGFTSVSPELTARLDQWIAELEAQEITFRGWAMPGASVEGAALDLARTVCRRAERRVSLLQEQDQLRNPEIIVFLNRLSDWLWLAARWVEPRTGPAASRLV